MADTGELTLQFLETHPRNAAKALEGFDSKQAAAFLETVPVRICAPVFGRATTWIAADWIELLPPSRAATVLQQMNYQDAAAIVRQVDETGREKVLEELPSGLARSFRRSLTYPGGTVGAWMDPSAPTFDEGLTVADGLKYLKSKHGQQAPHIIIVREGKKFAGMVSANDLLRSTQSTPLSRIAKHSARPLSSRAMLLSVLEDDGWDRHPSLPVVGNRGNVLGNLHRTDLKRGLDDLREIASAERDDSVLIQLFAGYFTVALGLAQLVVEPETTRTSAKR